MIKYTWLFLLLVLVGVPHTWAATYYVATTGSDATGDGSSGSPWKSFTFAINAARASCGDTLVVKNGTYGDTSAGGTSGTSKVSISGLVCTVGDELTIRAENSRQAKIVDSGSGRAVNISTSAYIIIDGLYARSTDNSGSTASESGEPFRVSTSNHITLQNNVARNVNRYANSHIYDVLYSQDVLLEDNEAYVYHRHCVDAWQSERVVVRRQYCNPRGGAITGGFGAANGLNRADSVMSMYPCKDCILENSIGDGTTSALYLNEMNATYGSSILMSGSQVLGSICYKCNYGNGLSYLNSRSVADLNHTPQNITIRNNALVNWAGTAQAIRITDGVGITLDHLTILGTGTATRGIWTEDGTAGVGAASNSITMTNLLVSSAGATGLFITGFNTWSGDEIFSVGNTTAFNPTPPSNWTNTSTAAHGMGTCTVWVPAGAAVKGAGTSGSDIGATILYRYDNGILTTTPLWDPTTGEFPYGAADPDGVNRVAGDSLFDIHTRLNVNTGGCSFPTGYGDTGSGGASTVVKGTVTDSGLSTTATPLTWSATVAASQDLLQVCVALWHSGASVGSVSGIDVSGQAMTLVKRQVTSPDAYRAIEMWKLTSPTAGSRTITVTLTGSISGALGRSIEYDATSGPNTAVGASTAGAASSLSITADTNTNELVTDCTVSSKSVTFTHGDAQTGDSNMSHSTQSLLLASSSQNGSDGGVMSNATGGAVLQAKVAVSLIAGTPDPADTSVLTQSHYRIYDGYGAESGVLAKEAIDTAATISPTGMARIRVEITGSVATTSPFNVVLYCRKNADSYAQVMDTFGSNVFRLAGAGAISSTHVLPASGSTLTQKLGAGNYAFSAFSRDVASTVTVPALTTGQHAEIEWAVIMAASSGDTVDCRAYRDDGTALGAYTVTPRLTIVGARSNQG